MTNARVSVSALAVLFLAACSPKGPAPAQCTADADCFSGGVCNAGGTCVLGAAIDKDKSTIDISQPNAVADGQDEVAITVTLRDAQGNALSSRGVQLSVDGTGNTLTQPSLSTNSIGQVVGKLVTTKAETKTITAVAGIVTGGPTTRGVTLTKTGSVTFVADSSHVACAPGVTGSNCTASGTAASTFAITAPDGSAPNVVVDTSTGVKLHIVLKDANGNPISGVTVNFSAIGTKITPASGTGTTGADGSFDATISSTVAQTATVVLSAGGISLTKTVIFLAGPAAAAHSTVTLKVGSTACTPVTCQVAADGSTGAAIFTITAHDQFDNVEPGAQVWFAWGSTETGNTITANTAETDYCTAKGATCAAQQQNPLLTTLDGTLQAQYSSPKAETKHAVIHVDGLTFNQVITVNAGLPDPLFTEFVILGHADGTPVIANNQLAVPDFWFLGAYIADKFDNPLAGMPVTFTSADCSTACVAVAGDQVLTLPAASASGVGYATSQTDVRGIVEGNVFALLAGPRTFKADLGSALGVTAGIAGVFAPGDPAGSPHSTISITPSSISSDPAVTPNDAQHTTHVTITLRDANDNPTPNQDLTLDALEGSLSGPSCVPCTFSLPTNVGAVYDAYLASSKAQTLYVVAAVGLPGGGVLSLNPQTLTVTAGGVNQSSSTVVLNNTSDPVADGSTGVASVTVTFNDTQGNRVLGVMPSYQIAPGTALVAPTFTPATTGANGQTVLTFKSTKAETETVTIHWPGPPGPFAGSPALGQTVQVNFVAGPPNAANTGNPTASPAAIIDDGVSSTTVAIQVLDGSPAKNPVSNVPVAFSASAGIFSAAPAVGFKTDANGKVSATYTSTTPTTSQLLTVTVNPGASQFLKTTTIAVNTASANPANSKVSGPATTTADGTSTGSLTFYACDPGNNSIVTGSVTLSCDGGGTVSGAVTLTGTTASCAGTPNNPATFTVKSAVAGTQTCTASLNGTPFKSQTVTFTPAPASATNSSITASPSSVSTDAPAVATVSVTLRDAYGATGAGNLVTNTNVTFAWASGPTGGFSCNPCSTGTSGTATVNVSSTLAGARTLLVVSPVSMSISLTFTPGAPKNLAFTQQPTDVSAGRFMAAVRVTVEDQGGNAVPTASASVTVVLQTSNGGTAGTLANNTVSTVGGVATFYFLVPTGTAGGLCDSTNNPCRTLAASASGLTAVGPSSLFHVILPFPSNGGEGALIVGSGTTVIPANNGTAHQYTTITIAAGARVVGDGNGVLDLRAQGDVVINGTIDVSGGSGGSVGNQVNGGAGGGGAGNATGGPNGPYNALSAGGNCINTSFGFVGCSASYANLGGGGRGGNYGGGFGGTQMGGGGAGGSAGLFAADYDYYAGGGGGGGGAGGGAGGFGGADGCIAAGAAGGGTYGGVATGCGGTGQGGGQRYCSGIYAGGNGSIGSSGCTTIAGSGGGGSIGCDAAFDLAMTYTLRPGSGGGGGGNGGDHNGEARSGGGGGGGGGGGAVRIASPTRILLGSSGAVLARGGNGGYGGYSGDDCVDDSGGGGGGGSGGAIWLQAPILNVPSSATIAANGGGGGAAAATKTAGPGGAGGLGRIRLSYDPAQSSVAGNNVYPPLPGGANGSGKAFVATYPQ